MIQETESFAVIEVFGHVRYVGRVQEVTRFGATMCQVEPIRPDGTFDPPVRVGGGAIFREVPISREMAVRDVQPRAAVWQLPAGGEPEDHERQPDSARDPGPAHDEGVIQIGPLEDRLVLSRSSLASCRSTEAALALHGAILETLAGTAEADLPPMRWLWSQFQRLAQLSEKAGGWWLDGAGGGDEFADLCCPALAGSGPATSEDASGRDVSGMALPVSSPCCKEVIRLRPLQVPKYARTLVGLCSCCGASVLVLGEGGRLEWLDGADPVRGDLSDLRPLSDDDVSDIPF